MLRKSFCGLLLVGLSLFAVGDIAHAQTNIGLPSYGNLKYFQLFPLRRLVYRAEPWYITRNQTRQLRIATRPLLQPGRVDLINNIIYNAPDIIDSLIPILVTADGTINTADYTVSNGLITSGDRRVQLVTMSNRSKHLDDMLATADLLHQTARLIQLQQQSSACGPGSGPSMNPPVSFDPPTVGPGRDDGTTEGGLIISDPQIVAAPVGPPIRLNQGERLIENSLRSVVLQPTEAAPPEVVTQPPILTGTPHENDEPTLRDLMKVVSETQSDVKSIRQNQTGIFDRLKALEDKVFAQPPSGAAEPPTSGNILESGR